MATNWTMKQACKVIKANEDKMAIADIFRRFPFAAMAIADCKDNKGAETILTSFPDWLTLRKVDKFIKSDVEEDEIETEVEEEEEEEKPKKKASKKKKATKKPDDDDDDDDDDEKPKKKAKKAPAKKSKKKPEPEEDEDDDDDDDWDI